MGTNSLLIGEVARRSGVSRKALRLYEEAGILPPPQRTPSGYRVYGGDALDLLAFVSQAQRLGFTLEEIRQIVAIKRSGRAPRPHVRDLVRRKVADLDHDTGTANAVPRDRTHPFSSGAVTLPTYLKRVILSERSCSAPATTLPVSLATAQIASLVVGAAGLVWLIERVVLV